MTSNGRLSQMFVLAIGLLTTGLASHVVATTYLGLAEMTLASQMAVKGRVSQVENDVTLLRSVKGRSSLLTARVIKFDSAEVWDSGGRLSLRNFVLELPSESLAVERSATVLFLLTSREDGLWDFTEDRSSYFVIDDVQQTAINLRHNDELWSNHLWLDPEFRAKVAKHMPNDEWQRKSLLALADKPWTSGPVKVALLDALLDARFH